jgi:SAM-dependent methyltransferase
MGELYDATFGRGFSAAWDRIMRRSEEGGLRELRREVLAEASGRTIDIGAGTGANLDLFPAAVTELFFVEPDPHMVKRLRPKLHASGSGGEVVQAGAEDLPFEESSVDTAVFALSLCTIPDPAAALAEVARVLRPGGRVLFLEHVRSDSPRLARWQDRLEHPWRVGCDGCYCNRDTLATIEASPLRVERSKPGEMLKVPALVRPLVVGSAVLPA